MLHDLLGAEIDYRTERIRAAYRPISSAERYGRRRRGRPHRRPVRWDHVLHRPSDIVTGG